MTLTVLRSARSIRRSCSRWTTRRVGSASRGSSSERRRSACGRGQLGRHALEPRARHGRDVHRQAALVERLQDLAELRERATADADRAVPARPADASAQPADLLLGHLDRIEALAAEVHRCAAELTERVPHAVEQVGVLLDEVLRTEVAAVLLVAQHREDQVATRLQLAAGGAEERIDEHRDASLHVQRAPSPDDTVDELGGERRVRPILAGGLHDVDVAVEQERRSVTGALDPCDEVRAAVVLRDDARLDTGVVEQPLDVRDARAFVAGRVRGVEPEQIAEELDDVAHGVSLTGAGSPGPARLTGMPAPVSELFGLENQVAVVTGASGVLGGAIARGLAAAGARIGLLARRRERLDALAEELGESAVVLEADVLDPAQLERARATVLDRWGRVDALVNAAGGNIPAATVGERSFFELPPAALDEVVRLNFHGTVLPSQVFGAAMLGGDEAARTRSIVNVSSLAAHRALTRVVGYGAAKAAVENLTRWLAVELAPHGVRVNAVAPGFFLGEQNRALLLDESGALSARGRADRRGDAGGPLRRAGRGRGDGDLAVQRGRVVRHRRRHPDRRRLRRVQRRLAYSRRYARRTSP